MEHRRNPGERAGLTHAHVVEAARELLAERGLAALSMRTLAGRLGVSPNALYSHVAGKTALIDEILDDVLAEVQAPTLEMADPRAGLHALMASTYEVLLAHPELVALYLARQGSRGPNAQRLGGIMLALLDHAGVRGPRAQEALRVLIVHTIGFAAFATSPRLDLDGDPALSAAELRENFDHGLRWL